MQNVMGIDVSKGKLDVCAIFDDRMKTKTVENPESGFKQLYSWVTKKRHRKFTYLHGIDRLLF